jgi:hypothetical protein
MEPTIFWGSVTAMGHKGTAIQFYQNDRLNKKILDISNGSYVHKLAC